MSHDFSIKVREIAICSRCGLVNVARIRVRPCNPRPDVAESVARSTRNLQTAHDMLENGPRKYYHPSHRKSGRRGDA